MSMAIVLSQLATDAMSYTLVSLHAASSVQCPLARAGDTDLYYDSIPPPSVIIYDFAALNEGA